MTRSPDLVPGSPVTDANTVAALSGGSAVDAASGATAGPQLGASREYRVLLAVAVVCYVLFYGWILVRSDGFPYVMDNNESFSSLWHAYNLYHFDFTESMGLTDETFSPHEDAHPFVHSHQGNFPRVFAFLIYVLGARTIESQIVVTTMTVGLLSCVMQYRFFSLLSGPRFALLAALVFMTDYLFYAQWQVVTYRVWHGFFVFGSLLCAHGAVRSPNPRRWLLLTGLTYVGLFYYELVFVAFVSLFSAFYALTAGWRTPSRVVRFGAAQASGGVIALAILFLQLALYLGWDGLREDLYLTYVARNLSTEAASISGLSPWSMHDVQAMIGGITSVDPNLRERLERFYDQHNLIFWWNLVDSRPLRRPEFFVATLAIWVFQQYTPLFVLLIAIVLGGWLLSADGRRPWWRAISDAGWRVGGGVSGARFEVRGALMLRRQLAVTERKLVGGSDGVAVADGVGVRPVSSPAASWIALVVVGLSLFVLAATVLRDDAYRGLPLSRASFLGQIGASRMLILLAASFLGTALLTRWLVGSWVAVQELSARGLLLIAAVLFAVTVVVRFQPQLYDQEYAPVWDGMISASIPVWLGRAAVLVASAVAVALVARGRRALLGEARASELERVGPYLLCGAMAYGIVYWLATGYVLTGYLLRFGPLVVFIVDALFALVVSVVVATVGHGLGPLVGVLLHRLSVRGVADAAPAGSGGAQVTGARPGGMRGAILISSSALVLLVFLVGDWTYTQRAYIAAFPPEQFSFLRIFAEPPYRGATFVVSTYAAPLSYFTHQWAYFDPLISNGRVELADGKIQLVRDAKTYLWLADRRANPDYQTPEFYACITSPSFRGLLQRRIGQEPRTGRCSIVAMVQRAESIDQDLLRFTLMARDETPADAWAVVRLNWEQLPYLRPLPGRNRLSAVNASLEKTLGQQAVLVDYEYVDPYQHPERGTVVRVYDLPAEGERRLLLESTDTRRVDLPPTYQGKVLVTVVPSDGVRVGPEYVSQPLEVVP